jgi:hypothetical protein
MERCVPIVPFEHNLQYLTRGNFIAHDSVYRKTSLSQFSSCWLREANCEISGQDPT